MRRVSKVRRRENEAMRDERSDFVASFACCIPWCRHPADDCHEIARGAHRRQAFQDRCAWLAPCRRHHDELQNAAIWPLVSQYALKILQDPEFYDRVQLNALRGRAPDAISEREVALAMRDLATRMVQHGRVVGH